MSTSRAPHLSDLLYMRAKVWGEQGCDHVRKGNSGKNIYILNVKLNEYLLVKLETGINFLLRQKVSGGGYI